MLWCWTLLLQSNRYHRKVTADNVGARAQKTSFVFFEHYTRRQFADSLLPMILQFNSFTIVKVFLNWRHANKYEIHKSSAVAEMGERGHNRHGPKRRRGLLRCCAPFAGGGSWVPV